MCVCPDRSQMRLCVCVCVRQEREGSAAIHQVVGELCGIASQEQEQGQGALCVCVRVFVRYCVRERKCAATGASTVQPFHHKNTVT